MKLRTLLLSTAAVLLAGSVTAFAGYNQRQTDAGSWCLQETTGSAITDRLCVAANGVVDWVKSTVANSAATNDYHEIALTTPVDTTGTNTHNALTVDLDIGNATGGTNAARALQIDALTGDAQVSTTGINIGNLTGTAGAETAIVVGTGWDDGLILNSPLNIDNTIVIDTTTINEETLKNMARGYFEICGDGTTVNNNTVYYGPSQAIVGSATVGQITCDTTAAGNTTEATADAPALQATAIYPLGMVCYATDHNAAAGLTYTLRSAEAAITPAISVSIADNATSGTANATATTAIASGATVAIAVASTNDVGAAPFICRVSYAY